MSNLFPQLNDGRNNGFSFIIALVLFLCPNLGFAQLSKSPIAPSMQELGKPFSKADEGSFRNPSKIYYPETWFHYIGGNVSKEGITKDLEAIAKTGISGVQLFHGQFGGVWPGVGTQITSLSANWDDAVKHTAEECRRLGLRFSMNNCPGWATSGGPWITPSNAMREVIWNRTDVIGGKIVNLKLPLPKPNEEDWRDYRDVTVLAFPTPAGDTGEPLKPQSVKSDSNPKWESKLIGNSKETILLNPTTVVKPHWVEVTFSGPVALRSLEFSSVRGFNIAQTYEPEISVIVEGILPDGKKLKVLDANMPQANWQDDRPITFACSELAGVQKYRISITNKYNMSITSLRLFSAAKKNNWEAEAGWTLRSLERGGQQPKQSLEAFLNPNQILDISDHMNPQGKLNWKAPKGNWTIMRIGHVNAGEKNGPAPNEATGWEADKFSKSAAKIHFDGYIGRLSSTQGPLAGGLLDGILIDSWECHTQSWTPDMEKEFERITKYSLRTWLPALFGYVIKDHRATSQFLADWRKTLNDLMTKNYYGQMSELAKNRGLSVAYETSAGDVVTGDILEYFKFADVPMCEFWQPLTPSHLGSTNYKPIKPAASAARMYGKPRVSAEAFTNMSLSWDERLDMLKEVANINSVQGVSHFVFHTYTHNPQTPFLPPGSSFGAGIGTPFIRGQTWWKFMPDFADYFARCTYLLERGKPVSDVLWYLGDEFNHKPNQNAPFPEGFKYDYCNTDVLLNRLKVDNGKLVIPEGISYQVLWLPDAPFMRSESLEKILSLVRDGATIVGDAPLGLATLSGGPSSQRRFKSAVKQLWGTDGAGIRKVGNGRVISGIKLGDALSQLNISADVIGGDALWSHRKTEGADWYFVTAPQGRGFTGEMSFRSSGSVEIWDPVAGTFTGTEHSSSNKKTNVKIDLPQGGSCFVVFRRDKGADGKAKPATGQSSVIPLTEPWTLSFPAGWGAPDSFKLPVLKAWKDLDIASEGKAFSGTANYTTTIKIDKIETGARYFLDLGKVDIAASIWVNGQEAGRAWAAPYKMEITEKIRTGKNTISVEVTSTWFNRLVFDAGQIQQKRKTWTISGPSKDAALRSSGLLGPVTLQKIISN